MGARSKVDFGPRALPCLPRTREHFFVLEELPMPREGSSPQIDHIRSYFNGFRSLARKVLIKPARSRNQLSVTRRRCFLLRTNRSVAVCPFRIHSGSQRHKSRKV